jgi:MFS transporter, NNP family, nitrate/nitrite transporter
MASSAPVPAGRPGSGSPTSMLALATLGFAVAFWAWALLGPLGPRLAEQLGLTPTQQSLLVAVPVLVGSLGRIPVGALTDRLGARVMFPAVTLVSVLPVLYLGFLADSFAEYLVGGFFLGVAGTAFAVGVPMVNAWFPPARRGLAIGIFGAGMGGTAISAFTTVKLTDARGEAFPFVLVAFVLAVYGVAALLLVRDAPGRVPSTGSMLRRTADLSRLPVTRRASLLYALGFGGFVAFSVYLPTYLKNAYGLSQDGAAMRTAGFVVLAVVMRPVGGWLSDRLPALRVLTGCFAVVAVLAAIAALEPPLEVPAGAVFLGLAAALGAASGACFAYVAQESEPARVGGVTGLVGAAGGLGGFVPPLLMGSVYSRTGEYTLGLLALAVVALAAGAWTVTLQRGRRTGDVAAAAR